MPWELSFTSSALPWTQVPGCLRFREGSDPIVIDFRVDNVLVVAVADGQHLMLFLPVLALAQEQGLRFRVVPGGLLLPPSMEAH